VEQVEQDELILLQTHQLHTQVVVEEDLILVLVLEELVELVVEETVDVDYRLILNQVWMEK
tara:strand:- start:93 stop:275 length:183 start_codon:yes stop_codon:yes gene_type:complete